MSQSSGRMNNFREEEESLVRGKGEVRRTTEGRREFVMRSAVAGEGWTARRGFGSQKWRLQG